MTTTENSPLLDGPVGKIQSKIPFISKVKYVVVKSQGKFRYVTTASFQQCSTVILRLARE